MMSPGHVKVLRHVTVQGFSWRVGSLGDGHFVQVWHEHLPDQRGRKWYVSPHATDREIVGTLFAACLAYNEHELREQFLYMGEPIFGPHLTLDAHFAASMKYERDSRGEVT